MNSLMSLYLAVELALVGGGAPHTWLLALEKHLNDYFLFSQTFFGGTDFALALFLGYQITKLVVKLSRYLGRRVKFYLVRRLS
jgi:hypothetical protein